MSRSKLKPVWRLLLLAPLLAFMSLGGCYYMQAASGQLSIMSKREPISRLLAEGELPANVEQELIVLQRALLFATKDLALPDNGSYRSYVDLKRPYVVWNVFAAPELSMQPKQWCYPIVGCVAYRGYFAETKASRLAERLRKQGFDAVVRGSPAYSTLGRFKDPVLNTMIRGNTTQLVTTLFHELAHQQLYVADDVEFNESYATAVADIGIERWVEQEGGADDLASYRARLDDRRAFIELSLAARERLKTLYGSDQDDDTKRAAKRDVFDTLSNDYKALANRLGLNAYPRPPDSNAALVPISTYSGLVPDFRRVYDACDQELDCFYKAIARVAKIKSAEDRRQALSELGQS